MELRRFGLGVFGTIAVVSLVLALAAVWLFVTQPVTLATDVTEGDVTPLVRDLASVIYDALRALLQYL